MCRSVTITCISELGWNDTGRMLADIQDNGGSNASQWDKPWQVDNAAGSANLVEIELPDRSRCSGEIEFLFLSHEHLDHLWGLQAVLRHRPDLPLQVPPNLTEQALAFIRGERPAPTRTDASPLVRHTGPLLVTPPDTPTVLYPGCVAVAFDCTGMPAIEIMIALGYPVVHGSGLSNSDSVVFDQARWEPSGAVGIVTLLSPTTVAATHRR